MGNQEGLCCLSRDKESYILNNELVIFRSFRNVMITVKHGDIQKESGEGVVCIYHNPDRIPIQVSVINPILDNLHKIGYEQLLIQNLDMELYKSIVFYHVKSYESERDLYQYYNGYRECLQQLNDDGYKEILICDSQARCSRAFSAEVLIRAIMEYFNCLNSFVEESQGLNLKAITIIHNDKKSTRFIKYELIKYIEEYQQPDLRKERQTKFMKFITSTKSVTSEVKRQHECDFSLKDFDLGDESKLILQSQLQQVHQNEQSQTD